MYSFETASSFAFCPTRVLLAFLTSGKCAASPAFLILYLSTNYIEWNKFFLHITASFPRYLTSGVPPQYHKDSSDINTGAWYRHLNWFRVVIDFKKLCVKK
jgi:hypothetical protein